MNDALIQRTILRRRWWTALLILVLMAALFGLVGLICHNRQSLFFSRDLTESFQRQMISYHSRVDPNVPADAVLFFGDSHIQGMAVTAVAPYTVNFGIGHDTTSSLRRRLPLYGSVSRAKAVIIMIGFNDLNAATDADILTNYEEIVQMLRDVPQVFIHGVLPVDEAKSKRINFNQRIRSLNRKIKELADRHESVVFLDVTAELVDSKGELRPRYHIGDGIHLRSEGYRIWIDRITMALAASNSSQDEARTK